MVSAPFDVPAPSRRRRVALLLAGAVLAALASMVPVLGAEPASAAVPAGWQQDMLNQVNAFRAANGRGALRLCSTLSAGAQIHTDDMAATGLFSHIGSDGSAFDQRIERGGYLNWTAAGENIGLGYPTVSEVMAGWISSPSHRANLLGSYNDAGFAITYSATGAPYWAQEFGAGGTCGTGISGALDDAAAPAAERLRVRGWTFDPDSPTAPVSVVVEVDGVAVSTIAATGYRPDIGAVFPHAGPNHGYDTTVAVTPGNHQVCTYGRDVITGATLRIDCRPVNVPSASPFGAVDTPNIGAPGTATIRGWAIDPDTTAAIGVHVYVDGAIAGVVTANESRPDVGAAFPAYGGNHGFSLTVSNLSGGYHQACAYGINVGTGTNSLVGCRNILVPSASPSGNLDWVQVRDPGTITVAGWAFDPEAQTSPLQVHVYVGASGTALTANSYRADIGAAFPFAGPNHGFLTTLRVPSGTHNVCAYGINVGLGSNLLLGCRTVTVRADPIGNFDGVVATGAGTARITGWAIDPDTTSPVNVHVYVDGQINAVLTAGATRADLAAAFPLFGGNHGVSSTITMARGTHSVCMYAINTGPGSANPWLGCGTVTV